MTLHDTRQWKNVPCPRLSGRRLPGHASSPSRYAAHGSPSKAPTPDSGDAPATRAPCTSRSSVGHCSDRARASSSRLVPVPLLSPGALPHAWRRARTNRRTVRGRPASSAPPNHPCTRARIAGSAPSSPAAVAAVSLAAVVRSVPSVLGTSAPLWSASSLSKISTPSVSGRLARPAGKGRIAQGGQNLRNSISRRDERCLQRRHAWGVRNVDGLAGSFPGMAIKDVVGAHRFLQRLWHNLVDENTGKLQW